MLPEEEKHTIPFQNILYLAVISYKYDLGLNVALLLKEKYLTIYHFK